MLAPILPRLVVSGHFAGRRRENPTCKIKGMAGAQHGCDLSPRLIPISRSRSKRPDPLPPGKGERRIQRGRTSIRADRRRILLTNPRDLERLTDPTLAIAAPRQCRRSRLAKRPVVDIAELREALDDLRHRRRALARPAALGDLA